MPPPLKKKKLNKKSSEQVEDGLEDFMNFEEYNSRIFKIEIEELLKEMRIPEIPDEWINQLKDFLTNIPETSSHKIDEFPLSFVTLPIMKKKNVKGTFRFITPEKITTIGSFALKTTCSAKLPYVMDMAVEIPKACWQGMDYLNERYHRKRALYLAYIAQALLETDFVENLEFTYQDDCHLKPVLLITPKGIKDEIVSLTAYPNEDAFKLNRFIPSRNNVRSSWYLGISDEDTEIPTYYYNSTILADLLLIKLNEFLKETISQENIISGIKLVKLWLIRRGLLSGYGRLNGFIITMFVAYLLKKGKLNCFMNPYQVFRCTLLALQHENFMDGISFSYGNNDQSKLEDFKVHPGVFLDESGCLNLLYSVNKETLDMVKHEAKLGLNILDNESPNRIFLLFMKNISPIEKFEYVIHLKGPKKFRKYSDKLCDLQSHLNFTENKIAAVIPKVCDILRQGLNKRILFLDVIKSSTQSWPVNNKPLSINCEQVSIGILLNPDVPLSNVEKGPLADDPKAKEFRNFWGDLSELRRFQDGSIREAVVWQPANTFEDKRKAFAQMIKDILNRHLSRDEKFVVNGCDVDKVLNIPVQVLNPDFLYYGTGEEAHVTLIDSFNSLSKELRKLDELPLQVSSVRGISPAFHYCDVYPPLPVSIPNDFSQLQPNFKNGKKVPKKEDFINSPFTPALNVVIEFEGSGKWPNDVVGIRKLKSIFLIKIAELVKSQYSLVAIPFLTHTDIVKDGFVFRIFIASHKELYLSKIQTSPNGMTKIQDTEESKQLDLTINIYPKLNSLLHGLQLQHFTFGTACRLAKRWISAQLKENYIHPTTVELLVAHVYLHPEPLTTPSSPQTGFIRFLSLLINHDWNISPLVINFNNELQKNEIEEIYTTFTDQRSTLPPMVIATPFDKRGTLWTKNKPTSLILKRIIIFAKASLETLQNNLFSLKDFDVKCIFRPPLDSFDVIVHLNHHVISKSMYAIDIGELVKPVLPSLKAYKKDVDKKYPLVELDVPKLFFEQLQEIYGEFAFFFYDVYGGDFIGIIWKKTAFTSKELKTSHLNCRYLSGDNVVGCKASILEDIKLLGKDIIKYVARLKD